MPTLQKIQIDEIKPLKDHIIVRDMVFKERITTSGIVIPNDDGKSSGIRPRWGLVHAVGPEQKDIQPGQYVLVEHGRWTRGVSVVIDNEDTEIRRIDVNDILLVSDTPQFDETLSNAV